MIRSGRIPSCLVAIVVIASLAMAAPIHDAVRAGDPGRTEKELKANPESVNAFDNGKSPLAIAVEKKDLRLIEMLVAAGANDRKDLSAAYDLYAAKVRANPSDEGVNFIAGLMSHRLGDYGRGIMEFGRALARNPKNTRAYAQSGLCYFALEQYDQAEEAFRQAKQGALPEEVSKAVDEYLDRIQKMIGWTVHGAATVGISHDSNLNVGPDHRVISIAPVTFYNIITVNAIELSEDSLPQASYVAEASSSIGVFKRLRSRPGGRMFVRADHYQSIAADEPDYDIFLAQLTAGLQLPVGNKVLQLPLSASHTRFGYSPLTTSYGIAPEVMYRAGDWVLSTALSIEQQDWEDADDRNGTYLAVTEKCRRRFGLYHVQLSAELGRDVTDSDVYSRTGIRLGAAVARPLPFDVTSVLGYTASIEEYDEESALETSARGDQGHDIVFALTRPLIGRARVSLRHVHTTNTSSFDLYDYTRDITTLTTSITF